MTRIAILMDHPIGRFIAGPRVWALFPYRDVEAPHRLKREPRRREKAISQALGTHIENGDTE